MWREELHSSPTCRDETALSHISRWTTQVPFMPTLPLAVAVLLLRFAISQMDVPARQSYTAAVVSPDERSAAAGVTGVARTAGAGLSPAFAGPPFGPPGPLGGAVVPGGVL